MDDRVDFKDFLQGNIKDSDVVVVYDLWCLSHKAGELVKIFTCLFKKKVSVHIAKAEIELRNDSPSFLLLGIINDAREKNLQIKSSINSGRPKGSISRSKFDELRARIIDLLREGTNVSEMSRILEVNRSSLKDYIHSRELKEIAFSATNIKDVKESSVILEQAQDNLMRSIECPFVKKQNKSKERK